MSSIKSSGHDESAPGAWTALILAMPEASDGPMASRLPSFLHPIAGRPLIWHAIAALVAADRPPEQVIVLTPPDVPVSGFDDFSIEVRLVAFEPGGSFGPGDLDLSTERALLTLASACYDSATLDALVASDGGWIEDADGDAMGAMVEIGIARELLLLPRPLASVSGKFAPDRCMAAGSGTVQVRTRGDLACVHRLVRDSVVAALMEAGVTFILPDSVVVDVDVRIGRDTIIYPGVTLEGQTTIGEETVIGPGSRIIDSWVGSGVEMKGWNYIAHTSVRNRAILEPHVRRGFD